MGSLTSADERTLVPLSKMNVAVTLQGPQKDDTNRFLIVDFPVVLGAAASAHVTINGPDTFVVIACSHTKVFIASAEDYADQKFNNMRTHNYDEPTMINGFQLTFSQVVCASIDTFRQNTQHWT